MATYNDDQQDSITEWIAGVRVGDQAAAQQLWERYFSRLMGFCRKRLPDFARRVSDEEDVVLNAMESFFRGAREGRFPQLRDRDELWRLLVVITARRTSNSVRDQQRQKRGGGRVVGESALDPSESNVRGIEQIVCNDPTPDFAVIFAEECEQRLLQLGDDALRAVAQLKLESHSNLEIAEDLGCSLRTVERKLALIRLMWTETEEAPSRDNEDDGIRPDEPVGPS